MAGWRRALGASAASQRDSSGPGPRERSPAGSGGPEPLVLGLDEAGRGSLLGPLVVGGFLVSEQRTERLRELGVRDSKQLSAARREEVYRFLAREGRRFSIALPPTRIDAFVRHGRLNELEARAFGRLVRRSGAHRVIVDACDPVAERFGRAIRTWSGASVPIVAEHRADETYPVVAAASIVAKVRRDRAIQRLRDALGPSLGSGYPSDPRTVAFVRELLLDGRPAPDWVRRSWRTMARVKPPSGGPTLESFDR